MPNYKAHVRANLFFALPLLLAGVWGLFHPPKEILITFGGCFAYCTLFMNPDLDLAHKIKLFSLRGLLTLPFRFYSRIFRHRGISHSILFGSLTRVLWLLLLAIIILAIIRYPLPSHAGTIAFIIHHKPYFIAAFAGLFLADFLHILLDKLGSK